MQQFLPCILVTATIWRQFISFWLCTMCNCYSRPAPDINTGTNLNVCHCLNSLACKGTFQNILRRHIQKHSTGQGTQLGSEKHTAFWGIPSLKAMHNCKDRYTFYNLKSWLSNHYSSSIAGHINPCHWFNMVVMLAQSDIQTWSSDNLMTYKPGSYKSIYTSCT